MTIFGEMFKQKGSLEELEFFVRHSGIYTRAALKLQNSLGAQDPLVRLTMYLAEACVELANEAKSKIGQ